MVQSSEEPAVPEETKPSTSATPNPARPKASGAGSSYTQWTVGNDAIPFNNRPPGDGKVPNSVLSVETLDGHIGYEGTPA